MSTAVKLCSFVLTCWKLNLAGAMEFRLSFLLTAGTMFVNNVVWILFWALYFNSFPIVNGWRLTDVMMMWAIGAGGYGIMAVFFGNAVRLSSLIAAGQLDAYLVQPKPVLLHVLVSRMSVTAIGDISFGAAVYACFGDKTVAGFAKFALGLAVATLIFLFFALIVHSLAFFIGSSEGLSMQMVNGFIALTTYPTDIFQGWGRLVLFTVVPAGFISYLPIGLLKQVQLTFLLEALALSVALCAAGIGLFQLGLRRYSSGNRMGMRM